MANDEHVALLKQGVDAWNSWRDENPDIDIDLSGATLCGTESYRLMVGPYEENRGRGRASRPPSTAKYVGDFYLGGFDTAQLSKVNLSRANFSEAFLSRAMIGANLSNANLFEANLSWANLGEAHLRQADLQGANLRELHSLTHISMAFLVSASIQSCTGANRANGTTICWADAGAGGAAQRG
jgi:uncharacterized protein YjbI with pentapeptide repeats